MINNVKFIIFTSLILNINALHNILTFNPGNYTISPYDYLFSKYIIVEMWGGGASGNACNGRGGGSGGYIKILIETFSRLKFNIYVGEGGKYTDTFSDYFDIYGNGNYSKITSSDNSINIISGGAYWYSDNIKKIVRSLGGLNNILSNNNSNIIYNINGNNETCIANNCYNTPQFTCPASTFGSSVIYNTNLGGNAPFGGSGGLSTWAYCKFNVGIDCDFNRKQQSTNGNTPGGGGGGSGINEESVFVSFGGNCMNFRCGSKTHGGDGLVNIYY